MTWAEKVFPDEKYREEIFSAWLKHVQTFSGTNYHSDRIFRIHCRDGNDKDIRFRAVFFENGKVLVIIEDITDQMQVLSP